MLGDKKILDPLIADLITLSYECKRKYQPIKEAAEACQLKVRGIGARLDNVVGGLLSSSQEVIQPFIMGCDTKNPKIVQMSLTAIQRLISQQTVDPIAASSIVNSLWLLMEGRVEELKLLQTAILLITTNSVVKHETLSKALALCFRMHFAKDSTTTNTAAATVRQLVSAIFERVVVEDDINHPASTIMPKAMMTDLKSGCKRPPLSLRPHAGDAFMLFQDFCQLLNAEQPFWLTGMTEMTRALCLELVEEVLTCYRSVFVQHPEFTFLLSEKVCPLIIRLFSPSLKYRISRNGNSNNNLNNNPSYNTNNNEKPIFPIVIRLLRIVSVLVQHFSSLLITESEIFLSLLVKFLDPEKASWQRLASLEVLSRLCIRPLLIRSFCQSYDMKAHSTKVLRDIINGVGVFIQSQFMNPSFTPPSFHSTNPIGASKSTGDTVNPIVIPSVNNNNSINNPHQLQAVFTFRNITIPLVINIHATPGSHKCIILDMLDKVEAPVIMEGYGLSLSFLCLLDIIRSINHLITSQNATTAAAAKAAVATTADTAAASAATTATNRATNTKATTAAATTADADATSLVAELVESSWCGILSALLLLLEASIDDQVTDSILSCILTYTSLCSPLSSHTPRDAFVTALCKAALPPYYNLTVLTGTPTTSHTLASGSSITTSASSLPSLPTTPSDLKHASRQVSQSELQAVYNETLQTNQVVVVGTALSIGSTSLNVNQGPVVLTTKNIQCMKTLLQLSQADGAYLGSSWYQALTTLQHLSWILGLRPSHGGSMKPSPHASDNTNIITTSITSDLPLLSQQLTNLFESTKYLDDVSLHHLISALCKISSEALNVGFSNREPSLFAVAKLLETGLVNLARVEVIWRPVTGHLLEACQHPHTQMRSWAAEAVTALLKSAFAFKYSSPIDSQPKLQAKLLSPLQDMTAVSYADIKHKQLECTLHLIQNMGESLTGNAWLMLLQVVGAVASSNQGESLVRLAFQSLQMIVTDFLLSLPSFHLPSCVDVVAMFATQHQELNISLTAVGLLWNIADHFSQNRSKISKELANKRAADDQPTNHSTNQSSHKSTNHSTLPQSTPNPLTPFDSLWLGLYCGLGELCVDPRPAIRKSAGQTLFSMIAAHGWLLESQAWHHMLWKVLFPLLENVKKKSTQVSTSATTISSSSSSAASNIGARNANILMHHSRDTAEKQWAETRFLTLAGVVRVASIKKGTLRTLGDFMRAWTLLLEYIEDSALCQNDEVSLASLKSFQELLSISNEEGVKAAHEPQTPSTEEKVNQLFSSSDKSFVKTAQPASFNFPGKDQMNGGVDGGVDGGADGGVDGEEDQPLWAIAWKVWSSIGLVATTPHAAVVRGSHNHHDNLIDTLTTSVAIGATNDPVYIPSQAFLTALVQTFSGLYGHIKRKFNSADLSNLFQVFQKSLSIPVGTGTSSFFILASDFSLTPLQEAVVEAIKLLGKGPTSKETSKLKADTTNNSTTYVYNHLYPEIIKRSLPFIEYSISPPKGLKNMEWGSHKHKPINNLNVSQSDPSYYVPFAESVMRLVHEMYKDSAHQPDVVKHAVCQKIIKGLSLPLTKKYSCPYKTTWVLAITTLLDLLKVTLPVAIKHEKEFQPMWVELGKGFESFLFSTHPNPVSMGQEEFEKDEQLDCFVVETIRDDILPHSAKLPPAFITNIMLILNRGSIHTISSSTFLETDSTNKLREEFSKICFETLLQFSFMHKLEVKKAGQEVKKTGQDGRRSGQGVINGFAIEALLNRCKDVLEKYVDDSKHCGNFPLPRPQLSEVSVVLQAVTTLMLTLKKNPAIITKSLWNDAIQLYPYLVECASSSSSSSSSSSIGKSVRDSLMQFMHLLQAPLHPNP